MMTDPIADMLTRLRNAGQAGHRWVDMPPSKLKVEVARLLKDNHFVFDFKRLDDGRHGVLRVYLKYHEGAPVIRHLERVSRPGRRHYVGAEAIPRVRNGLGMAILSTSRGLMSDRGARKEQLGGEVMALVW
jgi:small subunit ribosomal protein S8